MALQIRCPNEHVLKIDEKHLGKKIRCPKCQTVMQVAAPAPAGPPPLPIALKPNDAIHDGAEFKLADDGVPEGDEFLPDDRPLPKKKGGMKKGQRMRLARIGLALH